MSTDFEDALKDLVAEQFKDGEMLPLKALDVHDVEAAGGGMRVEEVPDEDDQGGLVEEGDEEEEEEAAPEEEEEAEEAAPEEEEEAEEEEKAPKSKAPRAEKRIRGLVAEVKALAAELAALKQEKEKEAAVPKKEDGTPYKSADEFAKAKFAKDPEAPKKPKADAKGADGKSVYKLGEFDERYKEDYDDYLEARREYLASAKEEFYSSSQPAKPDAAATMSPEFSAKLDATVNNGRKLFKDWDDVVVKGVQEDKWALSRTGAEFLVDSEVGPAIAYHLATNAKLAKEIADLPTVAQVKRLAKLEEQLQNKVKAKRAASGAPAPLKGKAKGGGTPKVTPFGSEDFEAVEARWNKLQKAR